jgi:hypothetical protein
MLYLFPSLYLYSLRFRKLDEDSVKIPFQQLLLQIAVAVHFSLGIDQAVRNKYAD